ncbi:hypothetical protein L226DRAFT_546534 [Lentinus tigrinus ALCF2SS1-7]|uniref:Uncharacterized protein n=1 Tax=Lentinus tigrinus ALCF2SS1-6 TaxID=1328759 RepID=A0A5C2S663_9APHY|nr:hypothetical protein L227DRAFT_586825 [Lentinus tigrinus ALCF2SS1-6]RPD73641.1 hypothetical protein L226DRAFT_546534 [Lentinus tigrinus ALCF2SS1-7]
MHVKRAGGSLPPVGSPLPLSANIEENRPEIGGSYGGFIALVVGLAVIFLASCIGVFFLLRNHEPTPYERQIRRARARQRDFSTELPIGPPGIRERLARLFGRRSGWIKASGEDGDEWDATEDSIPNAASELRERELHRGEYPASIASSATHPPSVAAPSASTDSVEVELRAPSGHTPRTPSFWPPENDRESRDASASDQVESPVSLRQSPPPVLRGEEQDEGDSHRDDRQFSVQSASSGGSISIKSMRKFDNGTKFKEGLNL